MSTAPAMPVFCDAYLGDTTHLTTEEHGAYLLLLMAMWRRNGTVPNDDKDLARIVGLTPRRWAVVKARLLPFLTEADGLISQKRLQKEWEYVQEKRNKNAQNGALGGRPRSNINNRLAQANGYQNDNPNESPHNPEPIPTEKADAFSGAQARKKGTGKHGWVQQRTATDAANSLIEDIERERSRTEDRDAISGEALRLIPAVGSG